MRAASEYVRFPNHHRCGFCLVFANMIVQGNDSVIGSRLKGGPMSVESTVQVVESVDPHCTQCGGLSGGKPRCYNCVNKDKRAALRAWERAHPTLYPKSLARVNNQRQHSNRRRPVGV